MDTVLQQRIDTLMAGCHRDGSSSISISIMPTKNVQAIACAIIIHKCFDMSIHYDNHERVMVLTLNE